MRGPTNWVAIGSIATVIVAIAAVVALFHPGGSPGQTPTPTTPTNTVTNTSRPSTSSPSLPATSTPTTGAVIRNHGLLTVANSYSDVYDLDSTSSSWGEGETASYNGEFEAYGGQSILLTYFTGYKQVPANSKIQFSTCEGTGYGGGGSVIKYSDLKQGEKLCFKTSEGRLSLLTVKSVSGSSLTFDVTTWEPTGQ